MIQAVASCQAPAPMSFQAVRGAGAIPTSIAAIHVRHAADALGELIGVIRTDDVLDVVFRQFCVGK